VLTSGKQRAIIRLQDKEREDKKMMKIYYYLFNDGYECWTQGQLRGLERKVEIRKHGVILKEIVEHH